MTVELSKRRCHFLSPVFITGKLEQAISCKKMKIVSELADARKLLTD